MADWYDDRYRGRRGREEDRYGYRNRTRRGEMYGGYSDYEGDYPGYGRTDYDWERGDYDRGYPGSSGYGYDDESDEDYYFRNRGITGGNRRQFGGSGYGSGYGGRYSGYYGGGGRGYGSGRMSGSGRNPSGYGYSGDYSGRQYGSGGRGYSGGSTGRGTYGSGNYGSFSGQSYAGSGRYSSSYGSGYSGSSFYSDEDYDSDFDDDFYDTDYEPTYWSYTEYWLIPGPYSGMGPQGYQRSDDRIEEDVCERLTQHGQIDASNIQVQVKDGVVTLTGTVDSRHVKRLAEDTVEDVSGVKDVQNELKVRRSQDQQHGTQEQGAGQHGKIQEQGQQSGISREPSSRAAGRSGSGGGEETGR